MAVDKFKFVSPGVFINEIDESSVPALPERMGPLIIGRFQKGPAGRPVKIESFKEFVRIFGNPSPGTPGSDVWRSGDMTAPTYAAYAAQAWLRNNTPCTVYRVLGEEASNATAGDSGQAGWRTDAVLGTDITSAGGAYGLFVMPNPDSFKTAVGAASTATLTVADGDDATANQFTEGEYIKFIATDGTVGIFILSDASETGAVASGTVLEADSDLGTGVPDADLLAAGTCIAVTCNLNTNSQATVLNEFKDTIGSTNSPIKDKISGGTITGTGDGEQSIIFTQSTAGHAGNTTITTDISQLTVASFGAGGVTAVTGTLAAVWYVQDGALVLTGTARDGEPAEGAGVWIKSSGASRPTFTAKVVNGNALGTYATVAKAATFDFNRDSALFIRKVFNTDPTQTNSAIVNTSATDLEKYWLGETFESNLINGENSKLAVTGSVISDSADMMGIILGLDGAGTGLVDWYDRRQTARAAATGWFISQDTRGTTTAGFNPVTHTEKLFKLHALGGAGQAQDPGAGASSNRDIKVSIENIKAPSDNFNKFGTFTVAVRSSTDTDNNPVVLERFTNVNLKPSSTNYIAKVIGDKYYTFDNLNKVVRAHGKYENKSAFLRVEASPKVDGAGAEGLLPFGVFGPTVPKTFDLMQSGSAQNWLVAGSGTLPDQSTCAVYPAGELDSSGVSSSSLHYTASIVFPTTRLRVSSSEGGMVIPTNAYFGYQSNIASTRRFDQTNLDLLRGMPAALDPHAAPDATNNRQYSWVFTLDDVKQSEDSTHSYHQSGSRALGNAEGGSWTAKSGSFYVLSGASAGFNKFTSPMFGGFDGFDVTEADPLRNSYIADGATDSTNSILYSIKKAIDIASDTDNLEFDLVSMPGITNRTLNNQLINTCEDRADAMAIVDLAGNYQPPHERSTGETVASNLGSVESVTNEFKSMNINSSYGCTFYPYVQIRDALNDSILYVPPSVVALGTLSSSQRKSAVWFAPAGFTRGGLSEGSSGLPVLGVRERLTSAQRDKLYDANINPIATFPAEGVVIFGQKTLQTTPSSLDRINVRRLLIYLKKEISRIASRLLFEQNVQATWERFTGQVNPFLEGVRAGLGITDFKVVLDETTTTPDLVDRNVMYAKIFLKPARAIEFIALDFIITRSGASFDD